MAHLLRGAIAGVRIDAYRVRVDLRRFEALSRRTRPHHARRWPDWREQIVIACGAGAAPPFRSMASAIARATVSDCAKLV